MKLSYSKAQSFKTCKRKFQYAFVDMYEPDAVKPGLMPNVKSPALALGTHGHAVMEHFFKALINQPFPYSAELINHSQNNAIGFGMALNMELQMKINAQIIHFCLNVFPHKGWRILAVEEEFLLPLGKDSTGEVRNFPFTVDLIVSVGGQIVVVDHKFSADAYKQERVDIEPQLPLYIGALRALGKYKPAYGIYNFMRTRKMNDVAGQVVQMPCKPNMARIKQSFQEHLETYEDVMAYMAKENPQFPRNTNNNCNYCDFSTLCGIEFRGDDSVLYRKTSFVANDYGYIEGE